MSKVIDIVKDTTKALIPHDAKSLGESIFAPSLLLSGSDNPLISGVSSALDQAVAGAFGTIYGGPLGGGAATGLANAADQWAKGARLTPQKLWKLA